MILVAGGTKGGSGKTTIATTLAILRAATGRDVLLIDADDQETASGFTVLRNERLPGGAGYTSIKLTGSAVRTETQRLVSKYDDVIVDTGGRDTASQRAALTVAEVLLVPCLPRSFDIWTLEKVAQLVRDIRSVNPALQAYTFLNRADPAGPDNDEAAEVLREAAELAFLETPIGARKAFGKAAAQGLRSPNSNRRTRKRSRRCRRSLARYFNTSGPPSVPVIILNDGVLP
jgi:chromosome partitioning protein